MALFLKKEFDSGFEGSYWRIGRICWEQPSNLTVHVAVYKDSSARSSGKAPFDVETYNLTMQSFEELNMSLLGACYSKLKLLPEFAGAVDC
jgi:hypothetical protein